MNTLSRKRVLSGLALAGAAAAVLAGCATDPNAGTETPVEEVDFLACAVSDEGSWNDMSFNQAAYEGLTTAKTELGIQINDAESTTPDDFAPNLAAMIGAGCDVTFAVGFNLVEAVNLAAEENPTVNFVTIDGWSNGATNLKPVTYQMEQSSYLAGYLAAGYSESKVVGTYGGMQIDAVTVFMDGFYYGAKAWGADNGAEVTVVGWDPATDQGDFVGDFANTGVAKSISEAQLEAGADVIYPVAGGLFSATYEAIDEAGSDAVFLGVDKDIALTSPQYADKVLTSVEKKMTDAVYNIIADLVGGAEFSGDAYVGTLENNGTDLSPFYDFEDDIDPALIEKLAELKAGIIDGSVNPLA